MTWRPLTSTNGVGKSLKQQADGSLVVRTLQECDGILEYNKHLREKDDKGWIMGGDMRRVASIPNAVVLKWMQEGIDIYSGECQDRIAAKLNDPDNFYLRTAPGRLGSAGDGTYR